MLVQGGCQNTSPNARPGGYSQVYRLLLLISQLSYDATDANYRRAIVCKCESFRVGSFAWYAQRSARNLLHPLLTLRKHIRTMYLFTTNLISKRSQLEH